MEPPWIHLHRRWSLARDPLSPFLFLFVADGLSAILKHSVVAGDITPIKICRRGSGISHLLFVDDAMLFFEASHVQAEKVKLALDLYSNATGQSLDFNKCSILFGSLCPAAVQEDVREVLHVSSSTIFEDKCLSLPTPRLHV